MHEVDEGILAALLERRVSRRSFLSLCAAMTAALALPASYAPRVAAAVAAAPRMPVIWLKGQGCGGNTDAFLRSAEPSVAELLLDLLSVDYHQALMVQSGSASSTALAATLKAYPNGYFAVVEGAVPTADDGVYLTIGGRPFGDIVREVCAGAVATIAVGSCAFDGGFAAAAGGTTGARGVGQVVSSSRFISLPGCPLNVENLTATIVHYLTFKELPPTDGRGRPLFAYGSLIHNQCGRRAHFEFGEFVQAWGDEGAQKGWCLYKMGCKGPQSFANCPSVRYGSGTSWPVRAGGACVACTMPGFWDAMSPFSQRLPSPVPLVPDLTVDDAGVAIVGGVGALVAAHGTATIVRARVRRARADRGRRAGNGAATATAARLTGPEAAIEAEISAAPEMTSEAAASAASETTTEPAAEASVPAAEAMAAPDASAPDASAPDASAPDAPAPGSTPAAGGSASGDDPDGQGA